MNTNKAAYWIALGVLALGLNSEYRHGNFVALHQVADRADSALCRISTHVEQTLAMARAAAITPSRKSFEQNLLASTDAAEMAQDRAGMLREQASDRAERIRERVQAQIQDQIREQADGIRVQAEMQHAQIEQMLIRTRSQIKLVGAVNRRLTVVCPKTSARISVNTVIDSTDSSPDVEVDATF
jgi:hypothetical protein